MEKVQNKEFVSALDKSVQRALSSWLYRAFEGKIGTYAGLIEHFGITEVIKKISPKVRGKVLTTCNGGGDAERASKMNAEIVANTIASMLDDKLVTPEEICKEISTDHMVEVLPAQELYRFLFGKPVTSKTFMAEVHKVIQAERLLGEKTASSYMSIIGDVKVIHEKTPTRLLASCQIAMLGKNRAGEIWSDEDLVGVYTPNELVEYVDLSDLFPAVEAVATLNVWVVSALPEGVADSMPPAPPTAPPKKADSDDPELAISGGDAAGALDLEIDDMLEVDNKKGGERPSITDDDGTDDEPTAIMSAEDGERAGKKDRGGKHKGPPPLRGR